MEYLFVAGTRMHFSMNIDIGLFRSDGRVHRGTTTHGEHDRRKAGILQRLQLRHIEALIPTDFSAMANMGKSSPRRFKTLATSASSDGGDVPVATFIFGISPDRRPLGNVFEFLSPVIHPLPKVFQFRAIDVSRAANGGKIVAEDVVLVTNRLLDHGFQLWKRMYRPTAEGHIGKIVDLVDVDRVFPVEARQFAVILGMDSFTIGVPVVERPICLAKSL